MIDKIRNKVSALKLIYGGQEVKKLACNLPDPAPVGDDDEYKKLKRKLNNHFLRDIHSANKKWNQASAR